VFRPPFVVLMLLVYGGSGGSRISPAAVAQRPTTFYVSPSGADESAGTRDAPWGTLRHAVSRLRAGDTLYLRGGVYSSAADTRSIRRWLQSRAAHRGPTRSPSPGTRGKTVTIRPPDGSPGVRLTTGAPHYVIFQDFTLDMSRQGDALTAPNAFYLSNGTHHIRLLRLDLGNTKGDVIALSYNNVTPPAASFVEILNSKIHHAGQGHR
jgi:hypothetical protein